MWQLRQTLYDRHLKHADIDVLNIRDIDDLFIHLFVVVMFLLKSLNRQYM